MKSIEFIIDRALASRSAQAAVASTWVWSEKSVNDWDLDLAEMDALRSGEAVTRAELRGAAAGWDTNLDEVQTVTRAVVRLGRIRFRRNPTQLAVFESLNTDARNRDDIYTQGLAARGAWLKGDPAWAPLTDTDLNDMSDRLATCETCKKDHSAKLIAWRSAAAGLNTKTRELDADNVAWYAEATTQFAAGTTHGDMIRSGVPTTTQPSQPVGPAVLTNVMVAGGTIHFDCAAPHATRFTYLHQPPGAAQFAVVFAETKTTSLTLPNQAAGTHLFKAFGSNSHGPGDDSPVVVAEVATEAPTLLVSGGASAPESTARGVTPLDYAGNGGSPTVSP